MNHTASTHSGQKLTQIHLTPTALCTLASLCHVRAPFMCQLNNNSVQYLMHFMNLQHMELQPKMYEMCAIVWHTACWMDAISKVTPVKYNIIFIRAKGYSKIHLKTFPNMQILHLAKLQDTYIHDIFCSIWRPGEMCLHLPTSNHGDETCVVRRGCNFLPDQGCAIRENMCV